MQFSIGFGSYGRIRFFFEKTGCFHPEILFGQGFERLPAFGLFPASPVRPVQPLGIPFLFFHARAFRDVLDIHRLGLRRLCLLGLASFATCFRAFETDVVP